MSNKLHVSDTRPLIFTAQAWAESMLKLLMSRTEDLLNGGMKVEDVMHRVQTQIDQLLKNLKDLHKMSDTFVDTEVVFKLVFKDELVPPNLTIADIQSVLAIIEEHKSEHTDGYISLVKQYLIERNIVAETEEAFLSDDQL